MLVIKFCNSILNILMNSKRNCSILNYLSQKVINVFNRFLHLNTQEVCLVSDLILGLDNDADFSLEEEF